MRVWIAKPCSDIDVSAESNETCAAKGCSAAEQHAACADIVTYHIREHLPAGARARVDVYEAHDETCKALADAIRKGVARSCRCDTMQAQEQHQKLDVYIVYTVGNRSHAPEAYKCWCNRWSTSTLGDAS